MTTNTCFCIWFSYIIFLHLIFTLAQSSNYIIHMNISVMPKIFSNQHSWYLSTLSSALNDSPDTTHANIHNLGTSKLIYTYNNVMNGFSANLSPTELKTLKNSPGYISSTPDLVAKLHTTHSPEFLGLNPNTGAWPIAEFGKDVIIGLVDSGIWPESESFKDDGLTKIPSRWKGRCENSIQFNSSLCNKKLIGAQFFNKGFLAKHPNLTASIYSTRDTIGHGTHTSSTAAGSQVNNVSFFGYANGSAKGVAPHARVAMYKVAWGRGEMYSSDIIAAIDSAISDGVDVLSLSFGFYGIPLYNDPVAIATFAAMEKGIFVSTSAGNAGPTLQTLSNGNPWVTTVGAGILDREFCGNITLNNGVSIQGLSSFQGNSIHQVPIVFLGLCNDSKELAKAKDKIVVCEHKNGELAPLVVNVSMSNVVAGVFISNDYSSTDALAGFASIFISPKPGEIIKNYIKNNLDSRASMYFKITVFGTKVAPSVTTYSSRGPSSSCPFVLKPDITAPGTSILAAWPQNSFIFATGTSMACPHVAGVAALLKAAHPDWSPATIRSAIMTTSDILDNTKEPIKDIGNNYQTASPLALGAGHVNPNKALDPGLIYDVGIQDYVNLLCALNFTQQNITTITRSSSNNCSKPSLDLNYPSFIVFNNNDPWSRITQEFQRTVTNVGEAKATYVANVTLIQGFRVNVIPNKLVFKEKNEKLSYKLKIEGSGIVGFGYLTWMSVKHVVRSPIVVTSILPFKF